MSVSDLVIIVPMLGRPHRVEPLLESIEAATPATHSVLFVATAGDAEVIGAINERVGPTVRLLTIGRNSVGDYAKKINTAYRQSSEPFMFLGACDLHFHPGWFEAAVRHFVDPTVGVVGTQDLCNGRVIRGEHSTHSLVSRRYVDQFGTIDHKQQVLHEGYPHEWVDDEFVETAKSRGAFRFERDSIVEHLHPLVGKAPSDPMYAAERVRMRKGYPIYRKRSRLWK
jgi:hypothetical protein